MPSPSRPLLLAVTCLVAAAVGLTGATAASAMAYAPRTAAGPPPDDPGTDDGVAPPDAVERTSPPLSGELSARPPLPAPAFWDGECDSARDPVNHRIGAASYRGVVTCGPLDRERPKGQKEPLESIGGGSSQYQWECVELVKRYMYLAGYIDAAYPADGKDIVADFPGHRMTAYHNVGTPGVTPQPGDVLALGHGTASAYGHTALVVGTHVDAAGDGTIDVLQENSGSHPTGTGAFQVTGWVVRSAAYDDAVDWLHDPRYPTYTPVGLSPAGASGAAVDPAGTVRVMVTGGDGYARELWHPAGGAWTGFAGASRPPGVALTGQPVGVVDREGVLRVFAAGIVGGVGGADQTGTYAALYERDRTATWQPWVALGGALTGRPYAVVDADGTVRVFAAGPGGAVAERDRPDRATAWTPWTPAGIVADPRLAAATTAIVDAAGTLHQFVVDPAGRLRERRRPPGATSWSGWRDAAGPVRSAPIGVLDATGGLRVVATGADGQVVTTRLAADATTWSPLLDLGGAGASAPAATVDLAGTVHVFAATPGGRLAQRTLPARASAWTAWSGTDAGPAVSALLGAAVDQDGDVYVLTRGRDGTVGVTGTAPGGRWARVVPPHGVRLGPVPLLAAVVCVRCGGGDPARPRRAPAEPTRTACVPGRRRRRTLG